MSVTRSFDSPVKDAAQIGVSTIFISGFIGLFAAPALVALRETPTFAPYGLVVVIGFAASLSFIFAGSPPKDADPRLIVTIIESAISMLYYSSAVILGVVYAGVAAELTGMGTVGILIAVLYPQWEMWTGKNGIPLTVAGLVSFIFGVIQLIRAGGAELEQMIREWDHTVGAGADLVGKIEVRPAKFFNFEQLRTTGR